MLNRSKKTTRSSLWSQVQKPADRRVDAAQVRTAVPLSSGAALGQAKVARLQAVSAAHPLSCSQQNQILFDYENRIKASFDKIAPTLKRISAMQNQQDFEAKAQSIARREFGFDLPVEILADAWVARVDMRRLFAFCLFKTYRNFCDDFFTADPLGPDGAEGDFQTFLQECGFHLMDISPCADGRLAHMVRYVLRLPYREVRRKSHAGSMFDVGDSLQKWIRTEMLRHRESRPNAADAPTRYLKVVAYHYSSVDPANQGCAAHGSDTELAAKCGLKRMQEFQQAVQNSFCCGATIDMLLIGLDTDTDAISVHVPDAQSGTDLGRALDVAVLYDETQNMSVAQAEAHIAKRVQGAAANVAPGMARLITRFICNNISQIDYVRNFHGGHYTDIGHAEHFIGAGIGFEEIQLRNLTYFSYMHTVEEAVKDLDVGIKIFSGLNVSHGLPIPVVVRFDYHGHVPGARQRAANDCARVVDALKQRYGSLMQKGLLHMLQVVRDCSGDANIEVLGCSVIGPAAATQEIRT